MTNVFSVLLVFSSIYVEVEYHILVILILKWAKSQSRYNRWCLSSISNMDFQFLAIWAVQGSTEKKDGFFMFLYCSVRTKKLHNISYKKKIGSPQDLNSECKSKDTLGQILFYLLIL